MGGSRGGESGLHQLGGPRSGGGSGGSSGGSGSISGGSHAKPGVLSMQAGRLNVSSYPAGSSAKDSQGHVDAMPSRAGTGVKATEHGVGSGGGPRLGQGQGQGQGAPIVIPKGLWHWSQTLGPGQVKWLPQGSRSHKRDYPHSVPVATGHERSQGQPRGWDGEGKSQGVMEPQRRPARGPYRCSRCGQFKHKHECPFKASSQLRSQGTQIGPVSLRNDTCSGTSGGNATPTNTNTNPKNTTHADQGGRSEASPSAQSPPSPTGTPGTGGGNIFQGEKVVTVSEGSRWPMFTRGSGGSPPCSPGSSQDRQPTKILTARHYQAVLIHDREQLEELERLGMGMDNSPGARGGPGDGKGGQVGMSPNEGGTTGQGSSPLGQGQGAQQMQYQWQVADGAWAGAGGGTRVGMIAETGTGHPVQVAQAMPQVGGGLSHSAASIRRSLSPGAVPLIPPMTQGHYEGMLEGSSLPQGQGLVRTSTAES
ncbi:unnamed protein product, partial [Discosporangium mesarthrocarpum]